MQFLEGRYAGTEESIRLLGVNTPEAVHPDKGVECYGPEASAFAKQMLAKGSTVGIEFDMGTGERDKYGRLLAHVWLREQLFNELLLVGGYAE